MRKLLLLLSCVLIGGLLWRSPRPPPPSLQERIRRALALPPTVEAGFVTLPFDCATPVCRLRLSLLPFLRCQWGDLDTIRGDLGLNRGKAEMLLTVENIDQEQPPSPLFSRRIPIAELELGVTVEIDFPLAELENEFGIFLCRDWDKSDSCAQKIGFQWDVSRQFVKMEKAGSQFKKPDSIYAFQYLFLSQKHKKIWAFSGIPVKAAGEAMQSFISQRKKQAFRMQSEAIGFASIEKTASALRSRPLLQMDEAYVMLLSKADKPQCESVKKKQTKPSRR